MATPICGAGLAAAIGLGRDWGVVSEAENDPRCNHLWVAIVAPSSGQAGAGGGEGRCRPSGEAGVEVIGKSWGRKKELKVKKKVYVRLVLAHWHRYGVAGGRGHHECDAT